MSKKHSITELDILFDRECHTSSLWANKVRKCENSVDIDRAVLAANWRMDHRVPKERGQHCLMNVKNYSDIALRSANICTSEPLSFKHSNNADNKLKFPDDMSLVRVVSLRSLASNYDSYGEEDKKVSALMGEIRELILQTKIKDLAVSLFITKQSANFDYLIDNICNARIQQSFGAILLRHLGTYDYLWWAGKKSELKSYLCEKINSQDLCAALGLGHVLSSPSGDSYLWLMILQYNVNLISSEQEGCYRPTVIEASKNTYHFPSPPSHQYGLTMSLSADCAPVDELIHDLPSFISSMPNIEHKVCDISFCKLHLPPFIEKEDAKKQIKDMRKQHREYLRKHYNNDLSDIDWIKKHEDRT